MVVDDQYSLNWGNHTHHIKKSFDSLWRDNDFVDVTLCCQGKKLKAHRMILSACSSYFHDVLRDNPCAHPIVILRDVEYETMAGILQFMYKGEVQVPTENFSSFLKTAELLEVSGLVTPDSCSGPLNDETKDVLKNVPKDKGKDVKKELIKDTEPNEEKLLASDDELERSKPAPASKKLERKKLLEAKKRQSESSIEEKKKPEPKKRHSDSDDSQQKKKKPEEEITPEDNGPDEEDDQEMIDIMDPVNVQKLSNYQALLSDASYLTKEANPECECPVCAQKFASIYYLKQHIPFHTGETKCQICGNVFSRKDLLRRHQASVHKTIVKSSTTK